MSELRIICYTVGLLVAGTAALLWVEFKPFSLSWMTTEIGAVVTWVLASEALYSVMRAR